jgi:uncharacterized phage protein (TIGR01671 family)
MKRELKFRVFDNLSKKMNLVHSIWGLPEVDNITIPFRNTVNTLFNNFELMQFTGLNDINGKDIYEGDIVKWGMFKHSKERFHRYAVVEINPDIKFRIIFYIDSNTNERKVTDNYKFNYGSFAYKDTENHLEVIGNIYETKNYEIHVHNKK